jgi:toxin ParE1/3/4
VKLIWTDIARIDRQTIRDYIAQDNPAAAIALDELITTKARYLLDYPHFGRVGRVNGTRELVIHRNYILVYNITGNRVQILRVLHAARQWP